MAAERTPRRFPVAVVGPGALGLLYASRLARIAATAVIARDAARAARLRAGVRVGDRRFRAEAFDPQALPRADWVIVLVKANDTAAAARLAARLEPRGVLSLQNGLLEDVLRRALPGVRCAQGVTTEAAYREGDRVVPAGAGITFVPPEFAPLARRLRAAGFTVRTERNLAAARLAKLLANVCINPVGALFRVRNGKLLVPPYAHYAEALAHEAAPVLTAEGLALSPEAAWARVAEVARATARNRSSMLQDLYAHRRTEIEQLTGALLRLARRHHIAMPTHRAFYRLIRLVDARQATPARAARRVILPSV